MTAGPGNSLVLPQRVLHWAMARPDRIAFQQIDRQLCVTDQSDWAALAGQMQRLGAALLDRGVAPGDRVVIAQTDPLDYVRAFLGTVLIGAIAVPLPHGRGRRGQALLRQVRESCQPRIGFRTALPGDGAGGRHGDDLVWLDAAALRGAASSAPAPGAQDDQPALLQYTSGTTARPKGARLSHGALLRQQAIIQTCFEHDAQTHILGWLPLNHDLGLIGNVLQTVYLGSRCTLMSARAFSSDPLCWLRAISKFGATTSGGPDSAYALVCALADEPGQADTFSDLDLSGWRCAFNGAEPIRTETLDRFGSRFAPFGFDPMAQYNSYGLAEASLLVTTGRARSAAGALPKQAHSGVPGAGVEVRIVNPDNGEPRADGETGEILVASPCLADGYWGDPGETRKTFVHAPHAGGAARRILRTGDLGWLEDGRLVVAGRIDSRFSIFGVNIDAHDVEADIAAALGEQPVDRVAAFVETGSGQAALSVLIETSGPAELDEREMTVRRCVLDRHGVSLLRVVFVRRGLIPRTTSGKPQRRRIPRLLDEGRLPPLKGREPGAEDAAADQSLIATLEQVLGRRALPRDLARCFRELGGDSLSAVRLSAALKHRHGLSLSPFEILGPRSLEVLVGGAGASRQAPRPSPSGPFLSRTARQFLVQSQFDGGSGASALAWAARIEGRCSPDALNAAWQRIARGHAALRARLAADALDVVLDRSAPEIGCIDASGWDRDGLMRDIRLRRAAPIEPGDALIRPRLYRLGPAQWVLLVVAHHALCDLTSLHRMVELLFDARDAGAEAAGAPLHALGGVAPPNTQDGGDGVAPQPVAVPTDFAQPLFADFSGADVQAHVDARPMNNLRALARLTGATVPEVFATLWALLLMRMGDSDSVDVVVPVDMRGLNRAETAIGCGIEPVLVRLSSPLGATLTALVSQTKRQLRDALSGRYLRAAQAGHGQPGPSARPAAAFLFHDAASAALLGLVAQSWHRKTEWGGRLAVAPIGLPVDAVQHGLALKVGLDGSGGAALHLEYATGRFAPETAEALLASLQAMLEAAPGAEDLAADIPLMSTADRDRLGLWENGPASARRTAPLLDRVWASAQARPEATAVLGTGDHRLLGKPLPRALRYADLVAHVERLAAQLAASGVGPADKVALALSRSPVSVVAMLAVMRLGAAFMPITPEARDARSIAAMSALGPRLWLTDGSCDTPGPSLDVTASPDGRGAATACPEWPAADPGALAYVLQTSGSSGAPKAVAVPHRAIQCRVTHMVDELGLGQDDVVLHKTAQAFDPSMWEVFAPLVAGSRLVVANPREATDPDRLRALVETTGVGVLHFVPSMLEAYLAQCAQDPGLSTVRAIVCSGEALGPALRDKVLACFGNRLTLWNYYGPTEAAIDVLRHRAGSGRTSPIGRPVAETEIRILDRNGRRAAIGGRGEIFIAGPQLADGYLGQPEATSAAFVDLDGRRFYKTGDEARWLASGQVDYLGRRDHQWKLRGQRVEREDIEARLRLLPGVAEAAAELASDAEGQAVLIAHVAPAAHDAAVDPTRLRQSAQTLLPAVMVPARFVLYDRLPKTAGGKLDRKRLGRHAGGLDVPSTEREAAGTPLAGIFARALRLDHAPADRSFFDLGGDSLSAIRLVALAREAGYPVGLQLLYAHPTPRDLERALQRDGRPSVRPAPSSIPNSGSFDLSAAQNALLFLSETDPEYEVYVTSLLLSGTYSGAAMAGALEHVLAKHDFLRLRCILSDRGRPQQIVEPAAALPVICHDLRPLSVAQQAVDIERFLAQERRSRFDWTAAPLLRVTVHVLSEHAFRLTLADPSLDGGCVATLLHDLVAAYNGLLGGKAPPPARALHVFRRFVAEERSVREDPAAQAFWRDTIARGEARTATILSHAQTPGRHRRRMQRMLHKADLSLTERLRRVARQNDLPLRSLLLAAHVTALWRLRGEVGGLIAAEVTGRPACAGADETLGIFNNILPYAVQSWPEQSWLDLARTVLRTERDAMPFRQFPLIDIQAIAPHRDWLDALFVHTDFQPYREMQTGPARLLDIWASDQTYAPLTAHATRHPLDGALRLIVDFDSALVPPEVARGYRQAWQDALTAFALRGHDPILCRRPAPVARPAAPEPRDPCVLIAARAAQWPDRAAVEQAGTCLSYRALDRKMRAVAAALRARGVGPEDLVALDVAFGPDFVVSLLGVLASGAAFVPLDRSTGSTARNRAILARTGARLVISDGASETDGAPVLPLRDALAYPGCAPAPWIGGAAAYVLFTSGTTGAPKGITVERAALSAYLEWAAHRYGFDVGRGGAVVTGPDVDMSLTTLLAPLLCGRLVQVARAPGEPADLRRFAGDPGLGVLKLSPSHLDALAAQDAVPRANRWPSQVILGGEAIEARHCAILTGADCDIVNEYGPSETTVGIMAASVTQSDLNARRVPLGEAVEASHVCLSDATGRAPGEGMRAELLLGGAQVARGYFGDPAQTAARFAPDPLGAGARVFHSGDLVGCLGSGGVVYAGRRDDQLKLNGHRIEPAQIEAVICELSDVAAAACAAIEGPDGRPRLGLGVVLVAGAVCPVPVLRAHLLARLGSARTPGKIAVLDALPLTSSGKLDRKRAASAIAHQAETAGAGATLLKWLETMSDEDAETWLVRLGELPMEAEG